MSASIGSIEIAFDEEIPEIFPAKFANILLSKESLYWEQAQDFSRFRKDLSLIFASTVIDFPRFRNWFWCQSIEFCEVS